MFKTLLTLMVLVTSPLLLAQPNSIVIRSAIKPNLDVTTVSTVQSSATSTVLFDKGIIAQSSGALSFTPTTINDTKTITTRLITGSPSPDGSFSLDLQFVNVVTKTQKGDQPYTLVDKNPMVGLSITALVDRTGKLLADSITLYGGANPQLNTQMKPFLTQILTSMQVEPSTISTHKATTKSITQQFTLPIPGSSPINTQADVDHTLQSIDSKGVATIQQATRLNDMHLVVANMAMEAYGSGSGTLLYDTISDIVYASDTQDVIAMTIDSPLGILLYDITTKTNSQTTITPPITMTNQPNHNHANAQ